MTLDATSARRRRGADSDLPTQRRRRRPRWWMVLLAAVAATVATVVVIQLLPNAADGPAVAGVTTVEMRANRFHPPVIQIKQGQTATWSFNDGGATTTSRARAGALATRHRGRSGTPLPRLAATGTPARCTWA